MRSNSSCKHTDTRPKNDHATKDPSDVEALQRKGHWIQARQHTEVEQRRSPAETLSVGRRRRGLSIDDRQRQVFGHAEQDSRSKDRLVVVDQAIT